MATNLFDRLAKGRPPVEKATNPWHKAAPQIELLLDWLVNRWGKDTVTLKEIRVYGPGVIRDGKIATSLAQELADRGWLIPVPVHRRNRREWRIAGKLPTAPTTVAKCSRIMELPG